MRVVRSERIGERRERIGERRREDSSHLSGQAQEASALMHSA
jgi:hypothetical protein